MAVGNAPVPNNRYFGERATKKLRYFVMFIGIYQNWILLCLFYGSMGKKCMCSQSVQVCQVFIGVQSRCRNKVNSILSSRYHTSENCTKYAFVCKTAFPRSSRHNSTKNCIFAFLQVTFNWKIRWNILLKLNNNNYSYINARQVPIFFKI